MADDTKPPSNPAPPPPRTPPDEPETFELRCTPLRQARPPAANDGGAPLRLRRPQRWLCTRTPAPAGAPRDGGDPDPVDE